MRIDVDCDMLFDLARAVYAQDTTGARNTLDLMRATGREGVAGLIMRARAAVEPLPAPQAMARSLVLPAAGADPHDYFGGPGRRPRFGAR